MRYRYSVRSIDGTTMTFETTTNIDFHALANTAIAFEDMYINMANVIYIQKEIISKGGAE
jgi:hypothetical protein